MKKKSERQMTFDQEHLFIPMLAATSPTYMIFSQALSQDANKKRKQTSIQSISCHSYYEIITSTKLHCTVIIQ